MYKQLFFATTLAVGFLFNDANAVTKTAPAQESRIEKTFKKIDVNGDGKITTKEYSDFEKATFARKDKNSDGVMVRGEFAPRHYANQAKKAQATSVPVKKTRATKTEKVTSTKAETATKEAKKKASEVKKIVE